MNKSKFNTLTNHPDLLNWLDSQNLFVAQMDNWLVYMKTDAFKGDVIETIIKTKYESEIILDARQMLLRCY